MIIQGDALEKLKELESDTIDLIVTDPPYFLPVQSYVGTRKDGYVKRSLADTSILKGFFSQVFKELERVMKPTASYYVFCDAKSYPIFFDTMYPYCKHVRLLIWDKMVSYNGYTWRHQHELIAWGEKDKSERIPTGDGDILKCRGVLQKDKVHPAQKPEALIEKLILKSTKEGDTVLDPFLGSGTTALVSEKLKRNWIGIELNEEYIKIAEKRLAPYRNQQRLNNEKM